MAGEREFEGATLQEALDRAAAALGIPEPKLHYRILDAGRRGLFGLGAKAVRIAIVPPEPGEREAARPAPAAPAEPREQPAPPERRQPAQERPARERRGRRRGRRSEGAQRSRSRRPDGQARADQKRGGGEPGAAKPRKRSRSGPRERGARPRNSAPPPQEQVDELVASVERMFELMSLELGVEAHGSEAGVRIELSGNDHEMLVQKDAEFLSALQFLLNRMARRAWPEVGRIQLSCDGYRTRRDQEIIELAKEVAGQVASTGEARQLQPLNPYERRLVHLTVREFDDLTSRSEGDGFLKQIRIAPR